MSQPIKLSNTLSLPDSAVTEKIALLGTTGCGKTNAGAVMAERMCEAGFPFVIIDPQGDWWGLRSKYPVTILGGEHADVPLEHTAGKVVADFVVNERHPTLLDLFGMGEGEMVQFVADFAKQLWKKNRDALHLFLDEADLFAPQGSARGHKSVCLGAMQNVVRRGRSRGLGVTMFTQRSAVLNKDLLTQAQTLFTMRLTAPQDLDAAKAWINYHGNNDNARALLEQVQSLQVGEAIAFSPAYLHVLKKIRFNRRKSFDSSATPKPGEARRDPKSWKNVDLSALSQRMCDTIERAKAEDPRELKSRIKELERELRSASNAQSAEEIEQAVAEAVHIVNEQWKADYGKLLMNLSGKMKEVRESIWQCFDDAKKLGVIDDDGHLRAEAMPRASAATAAKSTKRPKPRQSPRPVEPTDFEPNAAQQRILDAIAFLESIGHHRPRVSAVGFLAELKPTGGHFQNTIGPLRSNGLIERGDGFVALTPTGRSLANAGSAPQTIGEYHDRIKSMLKTNTSRKLFVAIAGVGEAGRSISNQELGELTLLNPSGGHFQNSIGPLKTLGLITRLDGLVTPTSLMFPEGLE